MEVSLVRDLAIASYKLNLNNGMDIITLANTLISINWSL